MIDKYYTIDKADIVEIKIKSSKFIGYAFPIINKEMALLRLEEIRVKHFDATHNCFAYQIGCNGDEFRYSDDGEPTGTAGKPILLIIKKFEISDIIIVVTRYFGGTKLGVGGLMRAYSNTAEAVLELCSKKIVNITNAIKVHCRYEEISLVKRILEEYAISFKEEYTESIEIIADIPLSKTEQFINTISYLTNAKAKAKIIV